MASLPQKVWIHFFSFAILIFPCLPLPQEMTLDQELSHLSQRYLWFETSLHYIPSFYVFGIHPKWARSLRWWCYAWEHRWLCFSRLALPHLLDQVNIFSLTCRLFFFEAAISVFKPWRIKFGMSCRIVGTECKRSPSIHKCSYKRSTVDRKPPWVVESGSFRLGSVNTQL